MSTSLNDMEVRLCGALSEWVKAEAERVLPLSYRSSGAEFWVVRANGDTRTFSHLEISQGGFSSAEMAARWLLSCIIQDNVFEPPSGIVWRRDPEITRSHSVQGVSWIAYARFSILFLSPGDEVRT